jgi:hypothetical protein
MTTRDRRADGTETEDAHNPADGERDDDKVRDDPEDSLYTSEPLEAEDGRTYVIQQQNVGPGNEKGGGEWPDPHTPPRAPAPGAP